MATLDINNPKYFDPFLKTLKDNTHINNHNENYSLIVENFGKLDQKIDMREIVKIVDKKRHIPHMVQLARNYMVKDILHNMDNKQLANKIRGCL